MLPVAAGIRETNAVECEINFYFDEMPFAALCKRAGMRLGSGDESAPPRSGGSADWGWIREMGRACWWNVRFRVGMEKEEGNGIGWNEMNSDE